MAYDPQIHHRHSLRLQNYDYSQAGAYFVTICTQNRECFFGDVVDGVIRLNNAGILIQSVWNEIPLHYPGVDIDEFVIMPNHIHGIIMIVGAGPCACPDSGERQILEKDIEKSGQPRGVAPTGLSLPDVVHRFKTMTTKRYIDGVTQNGWIPFTGKLWQRNYWEHVIRNEHDLAEIREYIRDNPARWESDELFIT